jgi:hypothetical protein
MIQDQDFELLKDDYALVARPCQLSRACAGGCGYGLTNINIHLPLSGK